MVETLCSQKAAELFDYRVRMLTAIRFSHPMVAWLYSPVVKPMLAKMVAPPT